MLASDEEKLITSVGYSTGVTSNISKKLKLIKRRLILTKDLSSDFSHETLPDGIFETKGWPGANPRSEDLCSPGL